MRQTARHQQWLIVLGISCVGLVAAMLLRFSGDAVLPFAAAVLVSSWLFGTEGGLAALVCSSAFALLFTVEPTRAGWTQFTAMVALSVAIALMIGRAHSRSHRLRSML